MSRAAEPTLPPAVAARLGDQSGVISGAQLIGLGVHRATIVIWRRRRLLSAMLPGVYADHTGEPSWQQRAWAAVLYAAEGCDLRTAALCGATARRAHAGPGRKETREKEDSDIHVAITRSRRVRPQPGVRIHRVSWLDEDHVAWNYAPPRQRYEHAVLDLAIRHLSDRRPGRYLDAVGELSRAIGGRRTTAERLGRALSTRPRATERAWLDSVIDDLASGTCSVLEHGYRTLVARAHELPEATYQARVQSRTGVIYRDAEFAERVIELDGQADHSASADRDRDLERDLDAELSGKATTRLSWGQVYDRSCRTAGKVARLLADDGWTGAPVACSPSCPAPAVFADRVA